MDKICGICGEYFEEFKLLKTQIREIFICSKCQICLSDENDMDNIKYIISYILKRLTALENK